MRQYTWKTSLAAGLLLGLCTGCSTMDSQTFRGQSPEAKLMVHESEAGKETNNIEQVAGIDPTDRPLNGEIAGALQNQLYDDTVSHYAYGVPAEGGYPPAQPVGYGQSPYRRWGNFDEQPCPTGPHAGFGGCPPQYQEQCRDHGGRRHRGIYHYHTYSYREPKNLVYPAPNQPGGVVTYPYYTHKGPSDFFYQGDSNNF